jgi:hypothetical protein
MNNDFVVDLIVTMIVFVAIIFLVAGCASYDDKFIFSSALIGTILAAVAMLIYYGHFPWIGL